MPALFLLVALACTREVSPDTLPGDGVTDPVAGEPTEPVEAPAPPPLVEPGQEKTPAELYAECEQRVEGTQQAGECTTDADCARAGCSQEVCVTASAAADVMTTCEIKPCFQVLDTCGCHDGVCSWTLKAEAPKGRTIPKPEDAPQ